MGVHHISGHISANYIEYRELEPPFICLVASGGHSHLVAVKDYGVYEIIGMTRDDAAGEAFDKAARAMGFPYPGGVILDREAQKGNPAAYRLPRPKVDGSPYDFSFSGLKTAVVNLVHNAAQKGEALPVQDLAASFQNTVAEILTGHLLLAAKDYHYQTVAIAGGVSANSGLRTMLSQRCEREGIRLYFPPLSLCGDNAAMIAAQGYYEFINGHTAGMGLNAYPQMDIGESFSAALL